MPGFQVMLRSGSGAPWAKLTSGRWLVHGSSEFNRLMDDYYSQDGTDTREFDGLVNLGLAGEEGEQTWKQWLEARKAKGSAQKDKEDQKPDDDNNEDARNDSTVKCDPLAFPIQDTRPETPRPSTTPSPLSHPPLLQRSPESSPTPPERRCAKRTMDTSPTLVSDMPLSPTEYDDIPMPPSFRRITNQERQAALAAGISVFNPLGIFTENSERASFERSPPNAGTPSVFNDDNMFTPGRPLPSIPEIMDTPLKNGHKGKGRAIEPLYEADVHMNPSQTSGRPLPSIQKTPTNVDRKCKSRAIEPSEEEADEEIVRQSLNRARSEDEEGDQDDYEKLKNDLAHVRKALKWGDLVIINGDKVASKAARGIIERLNAPGGRVKSGEEDKIDVAGIMKQFDAGLVRPSDNEAWLGDGNDVWAAGTAELKAASWEVSWSDGKKRTGAQKTKKQRQREKGRMQVAGEEEATPKMPTKAEDPMHQQEPLRGDYLDQQGTLLVTLRSAGIRSCGGAEDMRHSWVYHGFQVKSGTI